MPSRRFHAFFLHYERQTRLLQNQRIIPGNKQEIELKRFSDTTESLEYGQEFLRFRKRDGFLTTMGKSMADLKTAKS